MLVHHHLYAVQWLQGGSSHPGLSTYAHHVRSHSEDFGKDFQHHRTVAVLDGLDHEGTCGMEHGVPVLPRQEQLRVALVGTAWITDQDKINAGTGTVPVHVVTIPDGLAAS